MVPCAVAYLLLASSVLIIVVGVVCLVLVLRFADHRSRNVRYHGMLEMGFSMGFSMGLLCSYALR